MVKPKPAIRAAIYCRKSTDHGLEQDFNSLDAQQDACESYIASHAPDGWEYVDSFSDGGFSGGTMIRPGLQKMMEDIKQGLIDIVVVQRVDRLSRSLIDFSKMMEVFDEYGVAFVSVTQQFDTSTSMGKLILHVLLSFAQFEREMIAERTRDKIAAARRKGKYSGGRPLLGYDIERNESGSRLVINTEEAKQVKEIFGMYLKNKTLIKTAQEASIKGYHTKRWVTKKGKVIGDKKFDKAKIHCLLTNITYLGKTKYGNEIYEGEHDAIIDEQIWKDVQRLLTKNRHSGGTSGYGGQNYYLLKDLLHCCHCGCGMGHTYTVRKNRRYRYYVCNHAVKNGRSSCNAPSVSAPAIEDFVIDQVRDFARDPQLMLDALEEANVKSIRKRREIERELKILNRRLPNIHRKLRLLLDSPNGDVSMRVHELNEELRMAEGRKADIVHELETFSGDLPSRDAATETFADFNQIWDTLSPTEQQRVLNLLIERIDYDGTPDNQQVSITYRENGIGNLMLQEAKS